MTKRMIDNETNTKLVKGRRYTWKQVLEATGADGSPPYYLPHAGTTVVAVCVTPDLEHFQ
jgi:hypothetical protein